jgi:hypothetical protein
MLTFDDQIVFDRLDLSTWVHGRARAIFPQSMEALH